MGEFQFSPALRGEPLSARRCWICSSDDLTEDRWMVVAGRVVCGPCVQSGFIGGDSCRRTVAACRGRLDSPRLSARQVYAAVTVFKERRDGWEGLGAPLAAMLAESIMAVAAVHGLSERTLVMPVPSFGDMRPHMRTLATLAASRLTGLALRANGLRKIESFKQARLGRRARWRASAGAYEARRRVRGRTVIVVDDILTTGATLGACAAALYAAGAADVFGAVILRAVRKPSASLVAFGPTQLRVWWTEVDNAGCVPITPGDAAAWVRYGCDPRCATIVTAGPMRVPALGTESLHAWSCDCGRGATVALRSEWTAATRQRLHVAVAPPARRPSELLVALRHFGA